MKRILYGTIAGLALPFTLPALDIPAHGVTINDPAMLTATLQGAKGVEGALDGGGKRLVIQQPIPNKPYAAQFSAACNQPILIDRPVLAVIKARTVGDQDQGTLLARLEEATPPYHALASAAEVPIPHEWTELPVTFLPTNVNPVSNAVLQLQCGHRAQTIEVQSVHIHQYPADTSSTSFPRIKRTYAGRDANAQWRKDALERIEKNRKADLTLIITGSDGQPLGNTAVTIELRRHQFGFGTAVTAEHLTSDTPDSQRYRDIIDRYFSVVVFENDLKDANWEPFLSDELKKTRNEKMNASFSWLEERNIAVRGHYLMQIPRPYNFDQATDNAQIRERVLSSVRERLEFVKDRVYEWDVINHPLAWEGADMLNKRQGLERLDVEVYQLARTYTGLPFFVNEDQLFRPGMQHDGTYSYIRALQSKGFDIRGLGNQAHISDSFLPSPEHMLAVTDHYAKIVPEQSITEFDIDTNDEELAADFTRDILIAAFSHPSYTSFLFWGFWEGSHWKPEAASWTRDWTLRKRGEVIEEWLGKTWRTQLTLKTDAEGRLQWRGFPGWYEVRHQGNTQNIQLTNKERNGILRF